MIAEEWPEFHEFICAVESEFGRLAEVRYEGPAEARLRGALEMSRQECLAEIRKKLA